jgi:hypothetical protein
MSFSIHIFPYELKSLTDDFATYGLIVSTDDQMNYEELAETPEELAEVVDYRDPDAVLKYLVEYAADSGVREALAIIGTRKLRLFICGKTISDDQVKAAMPAGRSDAQ